MSKPPRPGTVNRARGAASPHDLAKLRRLEGVIDPVAPAAPPPLRQGWAERARALLRAAARAMRLSRGNSDFP